MRIEHIFTGSLYVLTPAKLVETLPLMAGVCMQLIDFISRNPAGVSWRECKTLRRECVYNLLNIKANSGGSVSYIFLRNIYRGRWAPPPIFYGCAGGGEGDEK